jgi:hypothetical protein
MHNYIFPIWVTPLFSAVLYMYFWVVVKSYYDEMGPSGSNAVVVTAAIEVDETYMQKPKMGEKQEKC